MAAPQMIPISDQWPSTRTYRPLCTRFPHTYGWMRDTLVGCAVATDRHIKGST
jgi:hypothetical protein